MTFKASLSGLNAAQADLDVISNNIANSETTGFKSSRTEFSDVYASAFSSIANTSPGAGVTVGQVSQQFDQGNLQFTSRDMDLAIEGQGFFVLRNT
ncbi:MAG: flagellar hook-basal body complex protein, partial [Gammaproteobacteria bacterium]|nr:flagellar hook-basal body complex protein [Gammaproteobacteria bacterium]